MVSLFGTASESCLEIADRAPCACCVRCRCARGYRTCGAPGVSTARAVLWGWRHAGRRATRSSPACGAWRPRGLPPALRVAHRLPVSERQQEHAGPRALGGFELARRYSLRALVGKRLARVKRRLGFLLPLRAGGLKGDGVDCHIACPIPIGTSLPPWEDLLRPHQRHHLRRCHKSTSRLT